MTVCMTMVMHTTHRPVRTAMGKKRRGLRGLCRTSYRQIARFVP